MSATEELTAEQRQRLAARLARARQPEPPADEIVRHAPTEHPPLSAAQRRLWFLSEYEPDSAAYNIPVAFELVGPLDVDALCQALTNVVRTHDVLHTRYESRDGEPIACVDADAAPSITIVDLDAADGDVDAWLADAVRRPFDLAMELPLRAQVARIGELRHVLLLEIHHVAADGWALSLILDDLRHLYHDMCDGGATPRHPALRYSDVAAWQQARLDSRQMGDEVEWWRARLDGAPAVTSLPTDRPRSPVASSRGGRYDFDLPEGVVDGMRRLRGVTPFMAALAALAALLQRLGGDDEVVIGAPIAGRLRPELESIVGCFVNTLALRVRCAEGATTGELLDHVRDVTLDAYEHQEVPFEALVDALQPQRDLATTPIFQVMLNVHNQPLPVLALDGIEARWIELDQGATKFDLNLALVAGDDGTTSATLTYATDLFDNATVERVADLFVRMLDGICSDPLRPVADIELVSTVERHRQLVEWNDTAACVSDVQTVHELIERSAAASPTAVAVTSRGCDLTYAELNRRANRLAHHLIDSGIGPDSRVAFHVDRSVEMVVAMVAILKAGGAYVPIDVRHPAQRVTRLIAESGAAAVVASTQHGESPVTAGVPVIDLDVAIESPDVADHDPCVAVDGHHLAYVLYTSGSTGRPKGVAVEHRNLVNYLGGLRQRAQLDDGWSYALVSTIAADLGATNVYGALTTGGRLHVLTYDEATDPELVATYFRRHHVDVMKLVPSHFGLLIGAGDPQAVVPHRLLILAGEPCRADLVQQAHELRPDVVVQNHYGPTETTVSMLSCDARGRSDPIPLGRPFPNVTCYVLDRHRQPVPIGIPGELYVGGAGVARGYVELPDATAERFVTLPFADTRVYRTGDRVRYRPDGTIEFIGRVDDQVKVRGYRVEPGEVEAALSAHPDVERATVQVMTDEQGDARLVGYVVLRSRSTDPIAIAGVRDALREQLPDHMVPSALVLLEALPLTSNGKIDRSALPAPTVTVGEASERPSSPLEAEIAAVWADVLGVDGVGVTDNFFDLGGDSFKAVRVVRKTGHGLGVVELFKHPTVRQLAERVESRASASGAATTGAATDGAGAARDAGVTGELLHCLTTSPPADRVSIVCVPYGGGSAITYQPMADALDGVAAVWGIELPGHDPARLDESLISLDDAARRCVDEIVSRIDGDVAIYGHCLGGALAVEVARRLEASGRPPIGVVLGGTFPAARLPGRLFGFLHRVASPDRLMSTRSYHEFLKAMGGFDDIDDAERDAIIGALRHDLREAEEYYAAVFEEVGGLTAPITCVVGEKDRATELYDERHREWSHFSPDVSLAVIEGAGHYFLKYQAAELAQLVRHCVGRWRSSATLTALPVGVTLTAPAVSTQSPDTATDGARPHAAPSIRSFGVLAAGQFVSLIGTALSTFGMGVWVFEETGRASAYAMILFTAMVPTLLAWPIAGAVADRFNRRTVMIVADTAAAVAMGVVALLLFTERLEIWHIYMAAGVGGIANAFQRPAYLAAIAQLVPKRYLGHANGIAQLGTGVGEFLAPILGGVLVGTVGLEGVIAIDMATFLIGVTALLAIRIPNLAFRKRDEPLRREIVEGWRYILRRPPLVAMVVFFVVFNYLFSLPQALITPLVLSVAGAGVLGLVAGAAGLGMMTGHIAMATWGGTRRRATGMVGFTILTGVAGVVAGMGRSAWFPAVGMFGLFLSLTLINAHWLSIIQSKVGLELQGRVLATNQMMAASMMPLGFLTAGPFLSGIERATHSDVSSMRWLLVATGAASAVWGVAGLAYRRLRLMEDELPDAMAGAVIGDLDDEQRAADARLAASTLAATAAPSHAAMSGTSGTVVEPSS